MNGKLSRTFEETLGVGQGKSRASDHYKVFNQPLLDKLEDAQLGIWCGDICVSVDGIADDVYKVQRSVLHLTIVSIKEWHL